jgi:hypothetical protein
MSLKCKFVGAIHDAITFHGWCVETYGDEFRIVSYYPPVSGRNDIQLNFVDGGCLVIYPDKCIDTFGPEREPDEDLEAWGEPIPWPFDFLETEVQS